MKSYWYMASPYAKYKAGMDVAATDVAKQAALCMDHGVLVYAPIVHGHNLNKHMAAPPTSHKFWLNIDKVFTDKCYGIIVCMLDGWKDSIGVNWEVGEAHRTGKPLVFMTPGVFPKELLNHEDTRIIP